MAIAFRASNENRTVAGLSHSVTTPSGTADGDVLYGFWFANGSASWSNPGGSWSTLINTDNATYSSLLVARLVVSGSPAGSYAAATGSTETTWGFLCSFTGADTGTPEDVASAYLQNAGGTYTTPSLTTVTANTVLICFWAQGGAGITITVDAATTGMDFGAAGPNYAAGYQAIAAIGATGTRTATGMTNNNTCASVAIRPYVAPAGTFRNSLMLLGAGG